MAEEKFEFTPLSEEERRALQERLSTKVDSHALAADFVSTRAARGAEWRDAIQRRFGFDPAMTLTELEGFDAGDGFDTADEPEVHALRRVPLDLWTADDTYLMLAYRHGIGHTIWLALEWLQAEPMIEARHFRGDLLQTAAKSVADVELATPPSGETASHLIDAILVDAETSIWMAFDQLADDLVLESAARGNERQRISDGKPSAEPDAFFEIVRDLNALAKARAHKRTPHVLYEAEAEMVFAVYRPRRGLEIVPADALADPEIQAHLEHEDTFYFRRETRFDVVADGDGVRLRHFTSSAINNWHGIRFPAAEEAKAYALAYFGVPAAGWRGASG